MTSSMRTLGTVLGSCLALALAACGADDEPGTATVPTAPAPPTATAPAPTATGDAPAPPAATTGGARPSRQASQPIIGIGEQQAGMFTDPRFAKLQIKHARLVVSYDTVDVKFERELVDTWIKKAQQAGVEPFITFGHSRVKPKKLPTAAEFRTAFEAFRKRYPQVRVYAPWNEVNHVSQPTHDEPERAAEYYNVVNAACAGCTVLAGDVLDQAGMTAYVKRYRRGLDGTPKIWGLHNYADANRFRKSGLSDLLATVKGDVWLTETGGIVRFGKNFPQSEKRAARAVKYVLALARRTPRVKRVYLYNWTGTPTTDRFDAGFIAPDGTTRPSYDELR